MRFAVPFQSHVRVVTALGPAVPAKHQASVVRHLVKERLDVINLEISILTSQYAEI